MAGVRQRRENRATLFAANIVISALSTLRQNHIFDASDSDLISLPATGALFVYVCLPFAASAAS